MEWEGGGGEDGRKGIIGGHCKHLKVLTPHPTFIHTGKSFMFIKHRLVNEPKVQLVSRMYLRFNPFPKLFTEST